MSPAVADPEGFIFGRAQWLSGRVFNSRPRGRGSEPHRRHCVVSFSKNINPSLVLFQPRKTRPFITERLFMGCNESNQTKKHFCNVSCLSLEKQSQKLTPIKNNKYLIQFHASIQT